MYVQMYTLHIMCNFGKPEAAVTEGNQRGGFYFTFSIVAELYSVMDNKVNGH